MKAERRLLITSSKCLYFSFDIVKSSYPQLSLPETIDFSERLLHLNVLEYFFPLGEGHRLPPRESAIAMGGCSAATQAL